MIWKLQENILDSKDIETLVNFIKTTARFTQFKKVREFEMAWSRWQGCKYSVFVNSGSSANLIMISLMKELHDWKERDEIIVPAVTWVTNISPIIQCGLKPVFVDVNLEDFSFQYRDLKKKITAKTRAIFITHLLGFPANIPKIQRMIGGRDIKIIEDCCESHGAKIDDVKVGNFGECSSFSFYWGHHMTTIEGGMLCTDNEEVFKLALLKRSHGLARELREEYHDKYKARYPDIDFNFLFLTDGFNVRSTELNAVLGLSQISKLSSFIRLRNRNHNKFLSIIRKYPQYLMAPHNIGISSFCLPFLFFDKEVKRNFEDKLIKAGIETRPIVSGNLLRQPFLGGYAKGGEIFENAEFLHTNGFYIGNNQFVNGARLKWLESLLKEFFVKNPD